MRRKKLAIRMVVFRAEVMVWIDGAGQLVVDILRN